MPAPRSYYDPTSAGFDETSVWKHVGDEPNWRKGLDIPQYPSYEEATISNGVITHQWEMSILYGRTTRIEV